MHIDRSKAHSRILLRGWEYISTQRSSSGADNWDFVINHSKAFLFGSCYEECYCELENAFVQGLWNFVYNISFFIYIIT